MEIIPPMDSKAHHGVVYRYANGVVMVHGGPSGCTFTGDKGTLRIDRGHLTQRPGTIVKEPLTPRRCTWRSRRATIATGSTASARGSARWPTWRSALARWRSRSWATWPTGIDRTLRWDPAKWEFVDDAEANQWLDRERRDPWQLPTI